jgi:hypothetical protein
MTGQYGPAGREKDAPCEKCPLAAPGFKFTYLDQNMAFTPAVVTRMGAESADDCLTEFAQLTPLAWQMGGSVSLEEQYGIKAIEECATTCSNFPRCQYLTFDYATQKCYIKTAS